MKMLWGLAGAALLTAAVAGAGTASADLQVSPDVEKAACPGSRFITFPNVPPRHRYATEEATCTVYSDDGIEYTVDVDFLTFGTKQAMVAQANQLPSHKFPAFAYAIAGNAQGDGFSLVYTSAMIEDPAPQARSTGQRLMTRLEPFGFQVYYM